MESVYSLIGDANPDLRDSCMIASRRMGISAAMVEKDAWVTLVLGYLFRDSPWRGHLLFKGGTCMSKCYGAIDRFSEDVDVLLDWRLLGYGIGGPPVGTSRKKQEMHNDEMVGRTSRFIVDEMIPRMGEDLEGLIGAHLGIGPCDGGISIRYPSVFGASRVSNTILLEIGPRGAWGMPEVRTVSPYISEHGNVAPGCGVTVNAISLERALYEKVLILHSVAARGTVPSRYSRHYYDVYSMLNGMGEIRFDHGTISEIVGFKRRFYPGAGYGYDTMVPGSFGLVPSDGVLDLLREDYRAMEGMIFGTRPSFDEIMDFIGDLETRMNDPDPM
ncbi:MAG: nucleotidyl transferase AbiEii/AbiGii toxin family protein [Candidatus Methanomethylophilaceae archaeon]|nr:nucleotidyl transferase AbiEii/AbiGii toxin family protein [Candidatus Methanomethylophilaceae archaeon]